MGKIVILDENTSNQIAAGEVVERPASVVKELVENSIDAGSTNISVEINNGGISLIKVVDNGSGIDEDDVEIAFERHATSKIRNPRDLESITTLGFRGEALASIASVATVELTTRVKDRPYGKYIKIQGGTLKEVSQTGCPVGTTFIVRDLFYNTPARFKFLKKDTTEAGYISDIISRIALGNPQISLRLTNNRACVMHTPGNNDLLSTIFSLYGKETAKECLEVSYEDEKIKIKGYAGKPEIARSNRNYQSIYINGRYIRNKVISSAVDEAYKTYLLKNKFAFIVLNLEINPMLVDVNVHPTKMEVRFSGEQDIFRAVYHAVNNALLSKSLIRNIELPEKPRSCFKFEESQKPKVDYVQQGLETPFKHKADTFKNVVKEDPKVEAKVDAKAEAKVERELNGSKEDNRALSVKALESRQEKEYKNVSENITSQNDTKKSAEVKEDYAGYFNAKPDIEKENEEALENIEVCGTKAEDKEDTGKTNKKNTEENIILDSKIIGQAFSTYILLQRGDNLVVIDQHAAHERIMFEKLRKKHKDNENLAQYLLASVVIELTNQEMSFVKDEQELFNKLGFIFESFGNNSIILRSVPIPDENASIKDMFLELVDFIMSSEKKGSKFVEEEALYKIACKSAVKANKRLDEIEIRSILKELSDIDNPYTCPHGRPTIIKITKYEFEKMFKRIV
ncbi:MAG: DNA mismatch repair endonuclease MutL [Bacillota bacterium]